MSQTLDGKLVDNRLVGTWEGSEDGFQFEGMRKEWLTTRSAGGFFIIDFKVLSGDQIRENGINTGRWWVKDGLFYEYFDASGLTDVYFYKVLSKNRIQFKEKKLSVPYSEPDYKFIDYRVKE